MEGIRDNLLRTSLVDFEITTNIGNTHTIIPSIRSAPLSVSPVLLVQLYAKVERDPEDESQSPESVKKEKKTNESSPGLPALSIDDNTEPELPEPVNDTNTTAQKLPPVDEAKLKFDDDRSKLAQKGVYCSNIQ